MSGSAPPKGRIELILGPMFSGKTTELLRRGNRHARANRRVVYIRPLSDTRGPPGVVNSHDGSVAHAQAVCLPEEADTGGADVVCVDEWQFFRGGASCAWAVELRDAGVILIVAALDGSWKREKFGAVVDMIPQASRMVKLHAVCEDCGEDAPFTRRRSAIDTDIAPGGAEDYAPACETCWRLPREGGDG